MIKRPTQFNTSSILLYIIRTMKRNRDQSKKKREQNLISNYLIQKKNAFLFFVFWIALWALRNVHRHFQTALDVVWLNKCELLLQSISLPLVRCVSWHVRMILKSGSWDLKHGNSCQMNVCCCSSSFISNSQRVANVFTLRHGSCL